MVRKCMIIKLFLQRERITGFGGGFFLFYILCSLTVSLFLLSPEIQPFKICHANQSRGWLCGYTISVMLKMI